MRGVFLLFFHVELREWGLDSWKLAEPTFMWRRSLLGTCHLESSEIEDREHEQARERKAASDGVRVYIGDGATRNFARSAFGVP